MNRFKGLDLVHRVPEELGKEVPNTEQEVVTKISPKKKKARRQHGCLRREEKWKAREKEKLSGYRVPEKNKDFLNEQCKEAEENNRMGKIEISSRKLEMSREHFMQGLAW